MEIFIKMEIRDQRCGPTFFCWLLFGMGFFNDSLLYYTSENCFSRFIFYTRAPHSLDLIMVGYCFSPLNVFHICNTWALYSVSLLIVEYCTVVLYCSHLCHCVYSYLSHRQSCHISMLSFINEKPSTTFLVFIAYQHD